MALTENLVKEFADSPAVFACKVASGEKIEAKHIEHPMFLSDMVHSNLFTLEEVLTIGQVIGIETVKECDALTPVTEEVVGGAVKRVKAVVAEEPEAETDVAAEVTEESCVAQDGNTIIISIKEGKDIYIELPL